MPPYSWAFTRRAISETLAVNTASSACGWTPDRGVTSMKFSPATQPAWFHPTRRFR